MVIVAAHRVRQQVGGNHPHLDAMALDQPLAGGGGEALRLRLEFRRQGFAEFFQLGKEVVLALDEVANPDRGCKDLGFGSGLLAAVERPHAGEPASLVPGAVEPDHRIGDARRVLGHLVDLMAGNGQIAEDLVGEHLGEIAGAGRLAVGREGADVDVEGLGQAQQELGGERPLVALEVIEVAGRDAEILGHPGLGEAQLPPQPLQPHAEEELALLGLHHGGQVS